LGPLPLCLRIIAPVVRQAVRALVLDPEERILLVRFEAPRTRQSWWATPGGGLEGQPLEEALRRELREEAGLVDFDLGPTVWTRRHSFLWEGQEVDQRETYILVRVPAFEPRPEVDLAAELVTEVRWWTLDEIEASSEQFAPRELGARLRDLLEHGPPPEIVDVGV
jgi:8-oxo-dGTP pyrophosphatase MutT (NUDIX family)